MEEVAEQVAAALKGSKQRFIWVCAKRTPGETP